MKIHGVIDYSFLYYKYKFQLETGKMKRLTYKEKDISQIYYSLRDIELFKKKMASLGGSMESNEVTLSICFDMPTTRKDTEVGVATGYKSNRIKRLIDKDIVNIGIVEEILKEAGYNTYRFEGYEADDLVNKLVADYKDNFDYTVIYTPDSDLLVNVDDKVGVYRYKAQKGSTAVCKTNYSDYVSAEYKCGVPYNAIMLFKSTVGDKSDAIPGINKFGIKAFDKLIAYLNSCGINWEICGDYKETERLLKMCEGYLTDIQLEQARDSLSLVRPMVFEGELAIPVKADNNESRARAYAKFNMTSLADISK